MSLQSFIKPVLNHLQNVPEDMEIDVLRELPVETLYLALKEASAENALWLFQNANSKQIQGVMDLHCWQADEINTQQTANFFKIIAQLGPEKIGDYAKNLDIEVLVYHLLHLAEVFDFDPQEPPNVEEKNLLITPNQRYAIILKKADDNDRESLRIWLNKLYAYEVELGNRIMDTCKSEQSAPLVEAAYQLKKNRMEDIGFIDYYESVFLYDSKTSADALNNIQSKKIPKGKKSSLYSGKNKKILLDNFNPNFLPEQVASPIASMGFTQQCLAKITDTNLQHILASELVRTLNASMVADKALQFPLDSISQLLHRNKYYFDVGLAFLSKGNLEAGAEAMECYPLFDVYHLGWCVMQDMARMAATIKAEFGEWFFTGNDLELLNQLTSRHFIISEKLQKHIGLENTLPEKSAISFTIALKIGEYLQLLNFCATYMLTKIHDKLALKEQELSESDSAVNRLLTAFFRTSSGQEFSCLPISKEEWSTLSKNFNHEHCMQQIQTFCDRTPDKIEPWLCPQLKPKLELLATHIKNYPDTVPDQRFFDSISWKSNVSETD